MPALFTRTAPACVQWVQFNPLMACVCAWCPDKAEGDEWAKKQEIPVTHGICAACAKKQELQFAEAIK